MGRFTRGIVTIAALSASFFIFPLMAIGQEARPPDAPIELVEITGFIDPPTSNYMLERLAAAQDESVQAIVFQLDTPGGLGVPTRRIAEAIRNSSVPVVVWIAPRGARAASAATFITMASSLAFMAEETELGPAVPFDLSHGTPESQVDITEASNYLRDLAQERGRDADLAERTITKAESIGAAEAVDSGVVDGSASSLGDLLRAMDGRTLHASAGEFTLETWDEARGGPSVTVRFQEMNLLDRVLHALTRPEVAFALLLIGMFGLIFELYNPGIGLAGLIGAACLVGSLYALSVLPTDWFGVLLVVAAVILLLVDLHRSGFGRWTLVGLIELVIGGLLMFSGAAPLQLGLWAIVAAVAGTLLFFVSVMTAALRVRLRRPLQAPP
jgi:membrane-bound serine protease (ClpP class)